MTEKISLGIVYNEIGGWAERVLIQSGLCMIKLDQLDCNFKYPTLFYKDDAIQLIDILTEKPEIRLVITNHLALSKFLKLNYTKHFTKSYISESEIIAINQEVFAIEYRSEMTEIGWHLDNTGNKIAGSGILVGKSDDVNFISFPWNFDQELEDYSALNLNNTFVYKDGYSYSETGTVSDFRSIRQIVLGHLKKSLHNIDLPFCYVDYKPIGGPYICLRLDADGFSKSSTEKCLDLSLIFGYPFSWFINIRDLKDDKDHLKLLKNALQDVQIHGYYHMVFSTYISNFVNLFMAKLYLLLRGLGVQGSAAPLGLWNDNYHSAMKTLGFKYSSEFSLSIDDIPFYPYNNTSFVLQIPTFNASIGVTDSNYYSSLLKLWKNNIYQQIEDKGVAIIYDHPLNRLESVIDDIAELLLLLKNEGVKGITMSEYAMLWRSRPLLKTIYKFNNKIEYNFSSEIMTEENFKLRIELPMKDKTENLQVNVSNLALKTDLVDIVLGQNHYLHLQNRSIISFYLIYLRNRILHKFKFN
jgi:hypothetical protein